METEKKKIYTLKEIAQQLKVPYHTISYWEKKFAVKPVKRNRKSSFFDAKAIEEFDWIKFLIKKEGYSVAGAKKRLQNIKKRERKGILEKPDIFSLIKKEISEILEILNDRPEDTDFISE
ncbi:MAG: MerR family transcriptional regulator [candidate division WOR-3 bacterium]